MIVSRREFLKYGSLVTFATLSTTLAIKNGYFSSESEDVFGKEIPVTAGRDVYINEIFTPIVKSEILPSLSPAPESWKLSLIERVKQISEPEFFTNLQGDNTRKIITLLFDQEEYAGMKRKVFRNNNCGQSTLTTIKKMCKYLNTGRVPESRIADVYRILDGNKFTDIKGYTTKYIDWNDSMYFSGISSAIKLLMPELISNAEFLTPDYGARYARILPQSDWPEALSKAELLCKNGGFVIIGCLKYGFGDILLATDVKKDGTAVVVDSYYSGSAERVILKDYFEKRVDPEAKFLGEQPGLLNIIGITPKIDSSL